LTIGEGADVNGDNADLNINGTVVSALNAVQSQNDYQGIFGNERSMATFSFLRSLRRSTLTITGPVGIPNQVIFPPSTGPFAIVPAGDEFTVLTTGFFGQTVIGYQWSIDANVTQIQWGLGCTVEFNADFDQSGTIVSSPSTLNGVDASLRMTCMVADTQVTCYGNFSYLTSDNFVWASSLQGNTAIFNCGPCYPFINLQFAQLNASGTMVVQLPINFGGMTITKLNINGSLENVINLNWAIDNSRNMNVVYDSGGVYVTGPNDPHSFITRHAQSSGYGDPVVPYQMYCGWYLGNTNGATSFTSVLPLVSAPLGFYDPDDYGFNALDNGAALETSLASLHTEHITANQNYLSELQALAPNQLIAYRDSSSPYAFLSEASKHVESIVPIFEAVGLSQLAVAAVAVSGILGLAFDATKLSNNDLTVQSFIGSITTAALSSKTSWNNQNPVNQAEWQVAVAKDIQSNSTTLLSNLIGITSKGEGINCVVTVMPLSSNVLPAIGIEPDSEIAEISDAITNYVSNNVASINTIAYAHTNVVITTPGNNITPDSSWEVYIIGERGSIIPSSLGSITYNYLDRKELVYVANGPGGSRVFSETSIAGDITVIDIVCYKCLQSGGSLSGSTVYMSPHGILSPGNYFTKEGYMRNNYLDAVSARVLRKGGVVKTQNMINAYIETMRQGSYRLLIENCHVHANRLFEFVTKGTEPQGITTSNGSKFIINMYNNLASIYEGLGFSTNLPSMANP
jgi:hypothetical protein